MSERLRHERVGKSLPVGQVGEAWHRTSLPILDAGRIQHCADSRCRWWNGPSLTPLKEDTDEAQRAHEDSSARIDGQKAPNAQTEKLRTTIR